MPKRSKRERDEARRAEAIHTKTRRKFLIAGAGAAAAVATAYGYFQTIKVAPGVEVESTGELSPRLATDVAYGREDAPVTVYEFASLTCSHCARFHSGELDDFIKGWVDNGQARLIYRHFPLDAVALEAALSVVALPRSQQPEAVSVLMGNRDSWIGGGDVNAVLAQYGLNPRRLSSSRRAEAEQDIVRGMQEARALGVRGTPSFIIGDKLQSGFLSSEVLGRLVEEA